MTAGCGSGSGWRAMTPRTITAVVLAAGLLGGCEADLHDDVGPRVPVPNVAGHVVRAGEAAEELKVELRRAADATVIDSTDTDDDGEFAFADVGPGLWEVKVSGDEEGDFEALTAEFTVAAPESLMALGALDVWAYGAMPIEPEDGARVARPTLFAPLLLQWRLPSRAADWARAQVYDVAGEAVWFSDKRVSTEVTWNGLGSEGTYAGQFVPAGDYTWRVKVGFADGSEARLDRRQVRFE